MSAKFHSCLYSRLLAFLIGSSTLGERFNPAKDCSDIVDNLPGAKDGFYWIKPTRGKLSQVNIIRNIQRGIWLNTCNIYCLRCLQKIAFSFRLSKICVYCMSVSE